MQILNAPTRAELDLAHSRSGWVHIGVPSVRNFIHQSPRKLACWLILACSSIPLHLFFNAVAFEIRNVRSSFGMTMALESFVNGGKYFGPGASLWNTVVPYNCSWYGIPGHEKNDEPCKSFIDVPSILLTEESTGQCQKWPRQFGEMPPPMRG